MVPEEHDSATVLFTEIVNFTPLAGKLLPLKNFEFLSAIYTEFDAVMKSFADKSIGVCKVETIGTHLNLIALRTLWGTHSDQPKQSLHTICHFANKRSSTA